MFGKRNTKARKLDVLQVQQIRKAYEEGATQGEIARAFGMSAVQIGRIVRGESWPTSAGARGMAPREADDVLKGLLALQEQVTPAQVELLRGPPTSLLDGGDAPDETGGLGSETLKARIQEMGLEPPK